MKRATPSFTVEYRQAKRPNTGSAKLGWAHAKPAPPGGDEKANRIAISAFKTVAAHSPSDVISPSILPGRILPRLTETAPVTGQADGGGAQSKSHGSASKAARAAQEPGDGTVADHIGKRAYPAEDLELSIAVAPILRLKDPTTSDLSVEKAGAPRSEKRSRRPAPKQEKLDNSLGPSAKQCEPAPVGSIPGLSSVGKPSSTTRASRILGRYVFRDELSPGESWKRRIEARRERRVGAVLSSTGLTRRRTIATSVADLSSQSGHHNFDETGSQSPNNRKGSIRPMTGTSGARPRRSSSTSLLGSEVPDELVAQRQPVRTAPPLTGSQQVSF